MRSSAAIVKDIKSKHFVNLESDEYKELNLELFKSQTYERNVKLIVDSKTK